MTDCLALRMCNICVEDLTNSLLSAAIFALILHLLSTIQFGQTYPEAPQHTPSTQYVITYCRLQDAETEREYPFTQFCA
ncbi:MAG: hypothetical protein RPU32_10305, partial [Candidatus Sedimenticola sp. (ex Thyasira tokunagai)]